MDLSKLITQKELAEGSGLTKRQVFYAIETGRIVPAFGRHGSGNTSYFDPALILQLRLVKERLDWGLTFEAAWREEDPVTGVPNPPKFKKDVPSKEYVCMNDALYNCGTVTQRVHKHGDSDWVHTGEPNTPKMRGVPFCDGAGHFLATPSTMEIV